MAKVELKQPIVEEIKASLDGAKGVVLVDHRGLTVEQDTVLRKSLREAGVTYKVYKNTLVKRAIEGTEFESLKDLLEGPSAIAISKSEATTPASIICKFAKTNDKLEVKGGVVEGAFYDAKRFCPQSRPEKNFLQSSWEAFSLRSPILLVLSSRSQRSRKHNLVYDWNLAAA